MLKNYNFTKNSYLPADDIRIVFINFLSSAHYSLIIIAYIYIMDGFMHGGPFH